MHILIYHFGALGDFISLLPFFSRLKKKYHCFITLLGKPEYGCIAQANNSIDAVIDAESSQNAFLFSSNPDREKITTFFSPFEMMYLFTNIDSLFVSNAYAHSSAVIKIQNPFAANKQHIIDYNLDLLQDTELGEGDRIPDLSLAVHTFSQQHECQVLLSTQKPVVAIHPGSGSPLKNLPHEFFDNVAARLRNQSCTIAWFSGPAEKMHYYPESDLHFHKVSLATCLVLLNQCMAYCGNDSGITHLAAAVGCPTVALFGPSDPEVWAPRGKNGSHIIYHRATCSPCHLKNPVSCEKNCLKSITVDEVIAAIISTDRGILKNEGR